ncbi:MAG: hypothetical protein A2087_10570 [Spirochaetes bacterium GWD1_61_31]|nr:MAG: hypothetical protein A2Y37_11945 [Spirochaetes bacterium GWB1_60_80]OHD30094.1 MAG: hypothetical protein A2004_13805 [Spirochaetes bacterium GWC1_61_12]OHD34655.1 MAG: hypothetical protein A2087_10570 [Spirochaetes bacterium GWD1_61_31]OHD46471.1 MAG: hypothetical protein A2Y35_10475 [Spirochaetes bacterium GWE1_60_18]OHD59526.1 MAG: hypothetical protein A2Y32_10430 [Spirochaetes bacterium GWF1_60_12]HAW85776.1 hypothetical protein [Spirochaetaceae bacterium]
MPAPQSSATADLLDKFNRLEQSGALDELAALRKENRELERIINDAAILITYQDIEQMFSYIISRILDHFIPQFLAFIFQPPRGESLQQYCFRNLKAVAEPVPERYYTILSHHFSQLPFAIEFSALESRLGVTTFGDDFRALEPDWLFPMQGIGGLYGIVILGRKFMGDSFSELEKLYMERMIRFLSVGIQNWLHHESSITDPKTGLFTHDYFIKRLDEEIAHARRRGTQSGMLIIDVDHFKNFNDSFGHVTGDEALFALAQVLKSITRDEDCVARFGGEEFCVLVSNSSLERLYEVAERVRLAVQAIQIAHEGKLIGFTISLGGRMIDGYHGLSANLVLDDADKALYRAKNNGRNRTEVFKPGFLGRATAARNARSPQPRPEAS